LISQSNFPFSLTKFSGYMSGRVEWKNSPLLMETIETAGLSLLCQLTECIGCQIQGITTEFLAAKKDCGQNMKLWVDTVWVGLEEGWRNKHWEIWLFLCRRQMSCTPAPIIENIQMHLMMILTSRVEHDKLLFCSR
jgi:hypothetical protein